MRSIVSIVLIAPALLFAVSITPLTVLPAETPVRTGPPAGGPATGRPGQQSPCVIGHVDTIGGTTYDWAANGPAVRMIANVPGTGIHALWMHSVDTVTGTTFPDRNMRYNFYDYATHAWNWIDPDFMQSGVNTYAERTGFGSLEADPNTGVAVISAHYATSSLAPKLARDIAPGAGIFEYCAGDPTIDDNAWAWVKVNNNGYYQLTMIDKTSEDFLMWSRATSWCNWDPEVSVPAPAPEPLFPDHNIAVSKVPGVNDVCITWVNSPDGFGVKPGYYRISTDAGDNWGNSTELPLPEAFSPGSESVPSFHITSLYPMYDKQNRLHIAAAVEAVVLDTNLWWCAEIWHWCAENSPNWSRIRSAIREPAANIGYNAMLACRPSLGQDTAGNLFVAWEEFDGQNYTPGPPDRLLADIWYSYSTDNGVNWEPGVRITDSGSTCTYRFPVMLDMITDTVMVLYVTDSAPGFFLYAEGPASSNPIVVQKWPNPVVGIQGPREALPKRMELAAAPNPFRASARLSYAVPRRGQAELVIYDASGRSVRTLSRGRAEPGRYTAVWDGRNDAGGQAAAGVYLYRYSLDDRQLTGKLTLTR